MASSGRPATVLIGHSLGGTAVLGAAPALPEVKAVVTVSAPYQPIHVAHLFDEAMDDVERKGVGEVTLGGKRLQIRKQLIEDLERADLSGCIRELNRPLLVMHSPTDETVGIDNAGEIFQAAMHPKSFISLDRCDHLLTERWQAERIAGLVAAWVDGYLPAG
jgi:pimeloyl-ACP methyl ester carboxylesterase